MGGVVLSQRGKVDGAVAQEGSEQGGAQQGQIAGAAGVAAEFGIFAPGDVAAVVVGAFDAPMAAAAGEPLARGKSGAFCGGDEQAGFAAGHTGFLVGKLILHGDNGGGMRKTELAWGDAGERQLAVFRAAMGAVVGGKRGALPWSACAAAACTAGALPLS